MVANTYIFHRNDQAVEQFEFDPSDERCLDRVGYGYFGRVLNKLEPQIKDSGLIFYVTGWTVHELPSYGSNVISCILQDEWTREVHYRDKIKMVFRTCGKTLFTPQALRYGSIGERVAAVLAQGKAFAKDGLGRMRNLTARATGQTLAPIYSIPLGYCFEEEVDFIPFEQREYDVFFAGSIKHNSGNHFIGPKTMARQRMHSALRDLVELAPDISVKETITAGFFESIEADNHVYLRDMMNARFCPIPRGANLETYRFYEAIRYGCIPIGEVFPDDYFYNGAPIVRLKNWSDIQEVVPALLQDKGRMQKLHEQSLDWWRNMCSEDALARHMSSVITSIMPSSVDIGL